jgi:uncharacterized surface protein with fasciclin (FAS1) repeats
MKTLVLLLLGTVAFACSKEAPPPVAAEPVAQAPDEAPPAEAPATPKTDAEKTVVDVAIGSPDHTTLVAAVKAADLVTSLSSPGGVYTVFAPTNAAFDLLPKGTVEALLKPEKKAELKALLQHHAAVPVLEAKDIKDGQVMAMSDGSKVTFHVQDGKVMVEDAHVLGSVRASNGIVHVIDKVLLPPAK